MTLIRQTFTRAARRTLQPRVSTQLPPQSRHTQRYYATNEPPSKERSGSQRGLLIAVALGVPAAYYFMTKGDTKKAVGDIGGQGHGANQEYKKSAEGNA